MSHSQKNLFNMFQDSLPIALFVVSIPMSLALLRLNLFRRNPIAGSASMSVSTQSIADLRKEYSQQGLNENELPSGGPMELFQNWLNDACEAKVLEPNAMCLATCVDNKPSARFVLLKGFDERGFVWYTNYNSRKGSNILENPNASITFWWGELERQVRVEGIVVKVDEAESDAYFNSRPRGSQLGAWSSNQSCEISDRLELEAQEKQIVEKFENVPIIPRPPHWGGYRLIPKYIEFWKGRQSRLHDRIIYEQNEKDNNNWIRKRLQP